MKHLAVQYNCDQFGYQADIPSNLTIHKKGKHIGVKFSCDQCDYQATMKNSLTIHKQAKHH